MLKNYKLYLQFLLITPAFSQNAEAFNNVIIDSSSVSESIVMTIFNSEKFYYQNNSISINNINLLAIDDTKNFTLVISKSGLLIKNSNYQQIQSIKSKRTLPFLKDLKKLVSSKSEIKNQQFIVYGNTPFGNTTFFNRSYNSLAVVTNTTVSKKYMTNLKLFCNAHYLEYFYTEVIQIIKKQVFSSQDISFISSNFSTSSHIRPPPVAC